MPFTKDTPSPPGIVKALEHSCHWKHANPNLFHHTIPSRFSIYNEFIPNHVFNLWIVPLYLVEHFVILFDLDGPKCDASKKVPNLNFWAIFTWKPLSEQLLFPVKTIIVTGPNSTKFLHDERRPPPTLLAWM